LPEEAGNSDHRKRSNDLSDIAKRPARWYQGGGRIGQHYFLARRAAVEKTGVDLVTVPMSGEEAR
jgi:hypothetical protein